MQSIRPGLPPSVTLARKGGGSRLRSAATAEIQADVFAANRAVGRIALAVEARNGVSRRARVREEGSLRVRFPGSGELEAVIVNTAGGIAGGDRFDLDVAVGAGASLTVTGAAAEKIYRSLGPDADMAINSLSFSRGVRFMPDP